MKKLLIAINWVNYSDPLKKELQEVAISVLAKNLHRNADAVSFNFPEDVVEAPQKFHVFKMLKRDSKKEIANSRRMPYIKEILDLCSDLKYECFGYINSDILLSKSFFKRFNIKKDVTVCYKKDIEKVTIDDFLNDRIMVADEYPAGVDGFFFRTDWWKSNKHFFPNNLVLGETEWDSCYNSIIQKVSSNFVLSRNLYHVKHERIWNLDSRGAVANMLIWRTVKDQYGLPLFPEQQEIKQ